MDKQWIWLVGLLAYYLYSAYAANKKKQEEEEKRKKGVPQKPQPHFNPTPASPRPNVFGDWNLPKPKPAPKPLKKEPVLKKPQPVRVIEAVDSASDFKEGVSSLKPEQVMTVIKEEEIKSPQIESYSFDARAAFIGSVIFKRPEY